MDNLNVNRPVHHSYKPLESLPEDLIFKILVTYYELRTQENFPNELDEHPAGPLRATCRDLKRMIDSSPQFWVFLPPIFTNDSMFPFSSLEYQEKIATHLQRSGSLGLHFEISTVNLMDESLNDDDHLRRLNSILPKLKENSWRWREVRIAASSWVASKILNDLPNAPNNCAVLELFGASDDSDNTVRLDETTSSLICPRFFRGYHKSCTIGLAIGWGNLQELVIGQGPINCSEIIYIIANAPTLISCILEDEVIDDIGVMAQTHQITVNSSLTVLDLCPEVFSSSETDSDDEDQAIVIHRHMLLGCLKLPGLKWLSDEHTCVSQDDVYFEMLHRFLDRSAPQLDYFYLSIIPKTLHFLVIWPYNNPIDITNLKLDLAQSELSSPDGRVINVNDFEDVVAKFLSLLSEAIQRGVLPKLKELVLYLNPTGRRIRPRIWSLLANFLEETHEAAASLANNASDITGPQELSVRKKGCLKTVRIPLYNNPLSEQNGKPLLNIDESVRRRLQRIDTLKIIVPTSNWNINQHGRRSRTEMSWSFSDIFEL